MSDRKRLRSHHSRVSMPTVPSTKMPAPPGLLAPQDFDSIGNYLQAQFIHILSSVTSLHEENTQLRADLARFSDPTHEIQQLREDLLHFKSENATLKHELQTMQSKVDGLPTDGCSHADIHALQHEVARLQQDHLSHAGELNVLRHDIATLQKDKQEITPPHDTAAQLSSLEAKLEETRTWASLFKTDGKPHPPAPSPLLNTTVDSVFVEQDKRASKAFNIRVRGIASQGDALTQANDLLHNKLKCSTNGLASAWRGKYDDKILFLKFKNVEERNKVMRIRAGLKGTFIFLDDDLTAAQYSARKEIVRQAVEKGQRVVFIDGKPKFFPRKQ